MIEDAANWCAWGLFGLACLWIVYRILKKVFISDRG